MDALSLDESLPPVKMPVIASPMFSSRPPPLSSVALALAEGVGVGVGVTLSLSPPVPPLDVALLTDGAGVGSAASSEPESDEPSEEPEPESGGGGRGRRLRRRVPVVGRRGGGGLVDAEGVGVVLPLAAPVSTSTHFWYSSAVMLFVVGWLSALCERRCEPHAHEHRRGHRRQGYRLAGRHMEPGEQRLPRGRVPRPGSPAGRVHVSPMGHLVSRHCASRSPRSPGSFLTDRSARTARSTCSCSVRPARSPYPLPSVASAVRGPQGPQRRVPHPCRLPRARRTSSTPAHRAPRRWPARRRSGPSRKPTKNPPKLETGRDTSRQQDRGDAGEDPYVLLEPEADAQHDEQDPDDQ